MQCADCACEEDYLKKKKRKTEMKIQYVQKYQLASF